MFDISVLRDFTHYLSNSLKIQKLLHRASMEIYFAYFDFFKGKNGTGTCLICHQNGARHACPTYHFKHWLNANMILMAEGSSIFLIA